MNYNKAKLNYFTFTKIKKKAYNSNFEKTDVYLKNSVWIYTKVDKKIIVIKTIDESRKKNYLYYSTESSFY